MNRILVKIILILVMLSYIIFLILNAAPLSCDKCTVTFNTFTFNETYNMTELFNLTKEKRCPIVWDRVQGYVKT